MKNHFRSELELLQKYLELRRDEGDEVGMSRVLVDLVLITLSMQAKNLKEQYYSQLKKLYSSYTKKDSEKMDERGKKLFLFWQLAKAFILKESPRIKDKTQAQIIFEESLSENILDHRLTYHAIYGLSEILLDELKISGAIEVINEIKDLTLRLYTMGESQKSVARIIDSLIFQSKLALITRDIKQATELMDEAKTIATEKGLLHHVNKVKTEEKLLMIELERFKDISQANVSIFNLIEQTRMIEYIKEAQILMQTSHEM
ncbi:MAG: hypothetical protein ACXADY_10550 [Candidatus Hodarchaeales archaeon]|jgi:hypothetical protein